MAPLVRVNFFIVTDTFNMCNQSYESVSGHVGLEFASIYTGFGSRVTVIARSAALLPGYDREIAELVQHTMEQRGIQFRFHSTVQQVQDRDEHTYVTLSDGVEIATDAILLAVGRTPVTKDLALEKAGVAMDERGFIKVDEFLRTATPNIWALGDVNGGPQFTYISLDDFRIVRDQFVDGTQHSRLDRRNVPSSLFIEPTLSHAGLTTEEAQAQGYEVKVAKLPAAGIPRAQQLQQTDGLLKAVVDAQTGHILGCTLFCADFERGHQYGEYGDERGAGLHRVARYDLHPSLHVRGTKRSLHTGEVGT